MNETAKDFVNSRGVLRRRATIAIAVCILGILSGPLAWITAYVLQDLDGPLGFSIAATVLLVIATLCTIVWIESHHHRWKDWWLPMLGTIGTFGWIIFAVGSIIYALATFD